MDLFQTIIFGVVEGITEFLPVSSTGHLILTAKILGLRQTDFLKSFEISIQLGAIVPVIFLYWRSLLIDRKTLSKVFVAFLPTAGLGLIFYKIIKQYLLNSEKIVLISLLTGGVLLILFELLHREKTDAVKDLSGISFKQAFLIGVCQSLAMVPGVSRSLATILGGLSLGLQRRTIVQFSFLLAIPTILSATALDLMKSSASFSHDQLYSLAAGFMVSCIVAFFSVKFLLSYIQKHNFILFGVYRVLAAGAFWFLLIR